MERKRLLVITAAVIIIIALIALVAFSFVLQSQNRGVETVTSNPRKSEYVTEFPTQNNETAPNGVAIDSHGSVWFTLQNESALAKLEPNNGTITEYHIPLAKNTGTTTWGIAVDNSRDLVWFTELVSNSLWSFNMTDHKFAQYQLKTPASFPYGIAIDRNGDVWFTEILGNKIGEITANGTLSEFNIPLPGGYLEPSGITIDNSSRVWFTLAGIDEVGSYFHGQFQFYNLTGLIVTPVSIAVDSRGNLWLTQHGPSFISEFNPRTGYFETISTSIPPPPLNASLPYFDYVDPSGNVWFNEHYGNSIAMYNPSTRTLTEYRIPTRFAYVGDISGMLTMNLSPLNSDPWFTEYFSGNVGTVNASLPPKISVGIQNNSGLFGSPLRVPNGTSASITVLVNDSGQNQVVFAAAVGNFSGTSRLAFAFSNASSTLPYQSTLTITNKGSKAGAYFVTITAEASNLAVSRVIEVVVP